MISDFSPFSEYIVASSLKRCRSGTSKKLESDWKEAHLGGGDDLFGELLFFSLGIFFGFRFGEVFLSFSSLFRVFSLSFPVFL